MAEGLSLGVTTGKLRPAATTTGVSTVKNKKRSLPQQCSTGDSGACVSIGLRGKSGYDNYRMAACRGDDGILTIGVFDHNVPINAEPFVRFGRNADSHISPIWNINTAPDVYTRCSHANRMGYDDWQGMIVAYMANILSDTRSLSTEEWLIRVAEFTLPKTQDISQLEDLSAATLRHLAAAHQLSCTSVKKHDIAAALRAMMDDLHRAGEFANQHFTNAEAVLGYESMPCTRSGLKVIGIKINPSVIGDEDFLSDEPGRYVLAEMDSNESIESDLSPWDGVAYLSKPLCFTVGKHAGRALERKSHDMVAKLSEFNPEMHQTLSTMFNYLRSEAVGVSYMQESSNSALVGKLDTALDALEVYKNATAATIPELAASEDGTEVMVSGTLFPNYKHKDAPALLANYSMDFWRAEQRMGRGSEVVEFDAADLAAAILHEGVVSLVGPPGVGKTSVVQQLAAIMGLPVFTIAFTKEKPVEQLIGCDKIVKGQQVWVDGEITRALRLAATCSTPVFVVLDERDHADPSVQSELHAVLERRPLCLPDGDSIPIGDNVCFVLTSNTSGHGDTTGRHSAANMSDTAFNSRVKCTFNVSYLRSEDEQGLLVLNGLAVDEAKEMVEFANSTRESVAQMDSGSTFDGMSEAVCLRHMLGYASCRARGMEMRKAFSATILASLPQSDRLVANELAIQKVSFYG